MRDPHADWWDKQERKNFGEPVHEDNDIMGVFALEQYPGQSTSQALFQIGCFISAVLTLCGVGYFFYPDKPSYPREFPGGLEKELGGPKAMTVRYFIHRAEVAAPMLMLFRHENRVIHYTSRAIEFMYPFSRYNCLIYCVLVVNDPGLQNRR